MYTVGMTIAEVLADTLATKSLTQDEAAARLGVKQSAVSRWIAGKDAPKAEYVPALVRLTGLSETRVVAAIHQQRRTQGTVAARVTALERELAEVREDLQRVVQLLEAREPSGT
jgi:predicted transcriptional regulator